MRVLLISEVYLRAALSSLVWKVAAPAGSLAVCADVPTLLSDLLSNPFACMNEGHSRRCSAQTTVRWQHVFWLSQPDRLSVVPPCRFMSNNRRICEEIN